ncbi:hypothetical protein T492DRAFT_1107821 [Pavlovales sp. CCMP2436]|nr:hypothetical protein T492DRAFT_1107821 [Pavlovales sp. CCMP2436]
MGNVLILLAAAPLAVAFSARGRGPSALRLQHQPLTRIAGRARAAPACVLDFGECLSLFLATGNLACLADAGVSPDALPISVVDDVVAGLTGGFVGVSGTVVTLELSKQQLKEEVKCQYCNGAGALTCGICCGAGCDACDGKGLVKCVSCGGSGRAVSSDVQKEQFRAIFGLFPEMRYGPESTMFDEREDDSTGLDWIGAGSEPSTPVSPGAAANLKRES